MAEMTTAQGAARPHPIRDAIAFAIKAAALAGLVMAVNASNLRDLTELWSTLQVLGIAAVAKGASPFLPEKLSWLKV